MCSSLPAVVIVTLLPGAPPPLGVGPQALPHSPMIQSERIGVAFQRPARVGDCARADPVSAQSNDATRNFSSDNRRIRDIDPARSDVLDVSTQLRSAGT